MKRIILLAAFLTALSCANGCNKPSEEGGQQENKNSLELKIMSFNIRSSTIADDVESGHSWDSRKASCVNMLKDQKPDIVGFQECHYDQREYLKTSLDGYELWATPLGIDAGGTTVNVNNCGNAAMAWRTDRFDVKTINDALMKGYFWLSETPEKPSRPGWNATDTNVRNCVWAWLVDKETGQDIIFFNTHLPYKAADNEARIAIMDMCLTRMKNLIKTAGSNVPVFFTGDMNAQIQSTHATHVCFTEVLNWMNSARQSAPQTTDNGSFNNYKYTPANAANATQIDYVFYRNAIASRFDVVTGTGYGVTYISDHWPVYAQFTVLR